MTDGRWSPSIIEGWVDEVEALEKWVAVFFSDPIGVDPSSVEVLGPAYARLDPLWVRSSAYSLTLDEDAVFRALAPGTSIAAMGVMTGPFSNVLVCREMVVPIRSYPTGGTFAVDVGEWVIGIQVPSTP
ncbi:MAG TPA: hypothetical protein VIT65_22345 [Microlunatus sp.]